MCSFLCMNIKLLRMYRSEQLYMRALTTSMGRFFVSLSVRQMCVQAFRFGYIVTLDDTKRRIQDHTYTNRCITQSWTGVRQYGQIFMLAVQRSHAS